MVGNGTELSGVTNGAIDVDLRGSGICLEFTMGLFFTTSPFNGHHYSFAEGSPAITGVSVDVGATTVPGFGADRVSSDATTVRVDLSGLDVNAGETICVDVATRG